MKALIIADLQNDFMPGGALAVKEGDQVISIANKLMPYFDLVVATQDWHPADHGSFAFNHPGKKPGDLIQLGGLEQVLWPIHCVQKSRGAAFVTEFDLSHVHKMFHKGVNSEIDSYSGFFDNGHRQSTGLGDYLKSKKISDVYVMGLATDYCVKYTVLDAHRLGFKTYLILDGCRGIDLNSGDVNRAIEEMKQAGVKVVQSSEITGK
jgi:nicotinamidase/pyrazinamidase